MWLSPPEQAQVPVEKKGGDEFMEWLKERGVTKEMFRDADDKTKEYLRTAFYQRGRKDADAVLLPPQR